MPLPKLLIPKDLTTLFKLSLKAVYVKLHNDEIPGAFQIGRSWYINEEILIGELQKKAQGKNK